MDTREAMLAAIREEPEDDTRRLAYADFVEEAGGVKLGAAIRTHLAFCNATKEERPHLMAKAKRAIKEYTKAKFGEFFQRFNVRLQTRDKTRAVFDCKCDQILDHPRFDELVIATMTFIWYRGLITIMIGRHIYLKEFAEELAKWHPLGIGK